MAEIVINPIQSSGTPEWLVSNSIEAQAMALKAKISNLYKDLEKLYKQNQSISEGEGTQIYKDFITKPVSQRWLEDIQIANLNPDIAKASERYDQNLLRVEQTKGQIKNLQDVYARMVGSADEAAGYIKQQQDAFDKSTAQAIDRDAQYAIGTAEKQWGTAGQALKARETVEKNLIGQNMERAGMTAGALAQAAGQQAATLQGVATSMDEQKTREAADAQTYAMLTPDQRKAYDERRRNTLYL